MAKREIEEMKEMFQSGAYVPFTLKGVLLQWAKHLTEPDTEFDPVGKYKVNCIVDEDIAREMKEIGFNVKKNKDDEYFVVPTRKPDLGLPPVENVRGEAVDARKIGNGTIADVEVKAKYYPKLGRLSIYIEKITIIDLVEYEGSGEKVSFGG